MNCQFDRELIALHAGGDLPADAVVVVDKHLEECAACRALLAEYREGMGLVAAIDADVRWPRTELLSRRRVTRAVWRWAAVAVLVLVAVTAATEAPALAALLRKTFDFGPIRARELTVEEAQQYQQREQAEWDRRPHTFNYDDEGVAKDAAGNVVSLRSTRVTFQEAVKAVDYHVLQPRYLPPGYEPDGAHILRNDRQSNIVLTYQEPHGQLIIHQFAPSATITVNEQVPEGASQTVTVSGAPALVIKGAWVAEQDGQFHWRAEATVRLTFTRDGHVIIVEHGDVNFPVTELIKVAESLE